MAFTYRGSASAAAFAATEVDCNRAAGAIAGDLLLLVVAFLNVAAGSGPWIVPNTGQFSSLFIGPAQGWSQVCWQAPAGTGVGIEVWAAILGTGGFNYAMFAAAHDAVAVTVAYGGVYNPSGSFVPGIVRNSATRQVTGNLPPAPSVQANAGDLIVACYGDLMTGAGFGTPSGFTTRIDVAQAGAGTVEAAIADRTSSAVGPTGLIIAPEPAASSSTLGATATLAIVPAPTAGGVGGVLEASMPPDLVVPGGWTFRFAAIDPITGVAISGVTVSEANIVAADLGGGGGDGEQLGPFMLVPGPGA